MAVQNTVSARSGRDLTVESTASNGEELACPACGRSSQAGPSEHCGNCELFECSACGLQYWSPRTMPDASWYEQMYGGRDQRILPLEPGHRYFLEDSLAPRRGALLDIGCGTGNFLAAAQDAGYDVTGIELDRNAANFAREQLGLDRIRLVTLGEFTEQPTQNKFDVITFFEVLEHQAAPLEFLRNAKKCLKPRGMIALSVPNRERRLTGPDMLDYPPNHFLRWNATALKRFLQAERFEILSVREQPAGVVHAAQMINMGLKTGMTERVKDSTGASFRDLMQLTTGEAGKVLATKPSLRQKVILLLGRIKYAACFPLAVAAYPYVRVRGYRGTYLYCLAKLRD